MTVLTFVIQQLKESSAGNFKPLCVSLRWIVNVQIVMAAVIVTLRFSFWWHFMTVLVMITRRRCCGQVAWNPVSAGDCDCVGCDDCSDFYFTLLMLMVKLCCHLLLSGGEAAWNPVSGDECKVKRQRRKRLPRLDTGHTRQGTNSQSTSWTAVLLCC